ncbi:Uncharacterised protein [uncultured archaeon]|nr:Uncharacterised protein [uncultured archaeon]
MIFKQCSLNNLDYANKKNDSTNNSGHQFDDFIGIATLVELSTAIHIQFAGKY